VNPALPWARTIAGIQFDRDEAGFGQEALSAVLDNVPVALAVTMGPEQRYVYANRLVRDMLGGWAPDLIGRSSREVMGAVTPSQVWAKREHVFTTGEPQEIAAMDMRGPNGESLGFWDMRLLPVHDLSGRAIGILTMGVDVTAEVKARAEAESRARDAAYHSERLALAIDATELGLWEWDARTNQTFWSGHQRAIFGLPAGEPPSYEFWAEAIHPEDRERVVAAVGSLMDPASGGYLRLEHRVLHASGEVRWVLARGRMFYDIVDGEKRPSRILGTVLDITERKQAEEERLLLARELNHRVKNLFAVTSGLVSLTARSAKTPKDMGIALRGRLDALARAHDLIQPVIGEEGVDRAASLPDLVATVLAPHRDGAEERLETGGPGVALGSNAATALTLVLHELATNAAKYGALSVAEGRLAIRWHLDGDKAVLHWTERSGPPVEAPTSQGFGSQLAEKSVTGQLGGELAYDWRPEGLSVTIALPLARLGR
jgi:PAS domain S-box-containing protein